MIGSQLGISAKVEPSVSRSDKQQITDDLTEAVERAEQQFSPDAGGGGFEARTMPGGGGGGIGSGATGAAAGGRLAGGSIGGAAKVLGSVALSGVLAERIYSTLSNASGRLQAVNSMFGTAMSLFWRPFGDFLGKKLRPFTEEALTMATNFNEIYADEGLQVAVSSLSNDVQKALADDTGDTTEGVLEDIGLPDSLATGIGNAVEDLISNIDTSTLFGTPAPFGPVVASIEAMWATVEDNWPGWPELSLPGDFWPDLSLSPPDLIDDRVGFDPSDVIQSPLSAQSILGETFGGVQIGPGTITTAIQWPVLSSAAVAGAIGWPYVSSDDIAPEIGWPYISGDDIIPHFEFGTITSIDLLDRIEFPMITADDILAAITGDGSDDSESEESGEWQTPVNAPDDNGPWAGDRQEERGSGGGEGDGGDQSDNPNDEPLVEPDSLGTVRRLSDVNLSSFQEDARNSIISALRNDNSYTINIGPEGDLASAEDAQGSLWLNPAEGTNPPQESVENPPEQDSSGDVIDLSVSLEANGRRLGETTREEDNLHLDRISSE